MKTFTFFFLFLVSYLMADAQAYQPFPTDSASWRVVRCFYFYPSGWHDEYTITTDGTDTIYDGKSFKKLFITNHHTPGTINDTIYPTVVYGGFREENKKVFMWNAWASTDTTVKLIYDFNSRTVGDTIYTNALTGNPNPFGHIITAVDSVQVGAGYRARLFLQDADNPYNTEYWIEGIGSSWGLPFATYWSITDNSYDLTCFYEGHELKYANPSPGYLFCQAPLPLIICDSSLTTSAAEQPSTNSSFYLYPNPASEGVTVNVNHSTTRDLTMNIYNVIGMLIRSEAIHQDRQPVPVNDLSGGLYIVEVKAVGWMERQKLMLQR